MSSDQLTMPKAMKKSSWEQSPPPSEKDESVDTQAETSGSYQEQDPDISFHPAVPQLLPLLCSCLI